MNPSQRNILRIDSGVVLALGLALLAPFAISLLYRDGSWASLAIPAAIMIPAGWLGLRITRPRSRRAEIYVANRDVLLSVTLAWVLAALLGGRRALSHRRHVHGRHIFDLRVHERLYDYRLHTPLSAVSFALYYLLYVERRPRILLDRELLAYLGILAASIVFVWVLLVIGSQHEGPAQSLRYSAFAVTSVMTTTGFITADFDEWATQAKLLLVLLMFVGGCAGSTAGGIKVIRVIIVVRSIADNLLRSANPQAVRPLRLGDRIIPEPVRVAVLGLFAAWVLTFVAATFLVTLQPDLDLISSATAVAATLNVIGPGLNQVGASESYDVVESFGRVVLTFCMLLGRLEILTALALLSPAFWRR